MIETARLTLRPHLLEDYEPYYAMASDPRVMQGTGVAEMTREEAWHRLMRFAGHWALLDYGLFAVIERDSGRYIGSTGLADFRRGLGPDFDGNPEAAWAIAPEFHNRGYAVEAAAAAHRWYDETRGPARSVCIIDPENAPSIAVAHKLGYRRMREGVYRERTVSLFERAARA